MQYEKVSKECRVTVDMEPSLFADLKSYQDGHNQIPVSKVIRAALREYLNRAKKSSKQKEG